MTPADEQPATPEEGKPDARWRVGEKLGRTLYCDDELRGFMDSEEDAARVVAALNGIPHPHINGHHLDQLLKIREIVASEWGDDWRSCEALNMAIEALAPAPSQASQPDESWVRELVDAARSMVHVSAAMGGSGWALANPRIHAARKGLVRALATFPENDDGMPNMPEADQPARKPAQTGTCPTCGSGDRFIVRGLCASDTHDPDDWHRAAPSTEVEGEAARGDGQEWTLQQNGQWEIVQVDGPEFPYEETVVVPKARAEAAEAERNSLSQQVSRLREVVAAARAVGGAWSSPDYTLRDYDLKVGLDALVSRLASLSDTEKEG